MKAPSIGNPHIGVAKNYLEATGTDHVLDDSANRAVDAFDDFWDEQGNGAAALRLQAMGHAIRHAREFFSGRQHLFPAR